MKFNLFPILLVVLISTTFCKKENTGNENPPPNDTTKNTDGTLTFDKFVMGADISFANQIEDHGGVFKDSGQVRDVYRIFKDYGTNLIRVRLWHTPTWTKTVYGAEGTQMYSDIFDAEKSIKRAKDQGMAVCLDFHYSDTWADPSKQTPPEAWANITDTSTLNDSVYQYTFKTLQYLNGKGLMPEIVQIGNEINCGLFYTNISDSFPKVNCCNGYWKELGAVINSGIKATREVSSASSVKSLIALHIADPKNLTWWFENIKNSAKVTNYDILGFSYYPLLHTTVSFDSLPGLVKYLKTRYNKKIMIMETSYPWTTAYNDNYNNLYGNQTPLTDYPFTQLGQYNYLKNLAQNMITAGGSGIIYWEPDYITSQMKDPWGTGSPLENCTYFDFTGNTIKSIQFMKYQYTFPSK